MLIRLKFQADKISAGKRLDKFIFENIETLSRMYLARQIAGGCSLVNGAVSPGGRKLREGDVIEIEVDEGAQTSMQPEDLPLDIVFEDAEIIVVNKPAEMLVHPTHRVKTGTLANALAFHLNFPNERRREADLLENPKSKIRNPKLIRPGLVHRLDKQTSGLMLVAKTERALRILSSHFERKLIEKRYLAVVTGAVSGDSGKIMAPIGRLADEKPHWRVLPDGKAAETNFQVLERREETTLLELEPVTGRTNQLRIHCAHAGFPIVGDTERGGRAFPRLCLHAAKLGFYHPNGGWLEFAVKPPPEFIAKIIE